MGETKIERHRRQCREATRRWRARHKAGMPKRIMQAAPEGIALYPIPGYSNYMIDDDGILYSRLPFHAPRIEDGNFVPWRVVPLNRSLRKGANGHNYFTVRIRADAEKKRKRVLVHRLAALAFLGPRPTGMFVAHEQLGFENNSRANLSYKTPKQNKADELRDGTRYQGEEHHEVRIHNAIWPELVVRWNAGIERKSDICREYKISHQAVRRRLARENPYSRPDFAGAFEGLVT
jgi:hypothetical protein